MADYSDLFEQESSQPKVDDYSDLFESDKPKAGINIQQALPVDSSAAAKSNAIAKRFGVTPGVASTFQEDYESRAKTEDAMTILDRSPKLRGWIADNPNNAKISHPDIGSLGETERTFKDWFTDPIASLASGGNSMLSMGAYLTHLATLPSLPESDKANDLGNQLAEYLTGVKFTGSPQEEINKLSDEDYARIQNNLAEGRSQIESMKSGKLQSANKNVQSASGVSDTLSALYENPLSLADFATQQVGQLGVIGKTMQVAGKGLQGVPLLQRMAAANVAVNATMGGADAGTQAEQTVRNIPFDQLAEISPQYKALIDQGVEPEVARETLAQHAGVVSGLIAAPISGLISKIGAGVESKFISQLLGEQAAGMTLKTAAKQIIPTLAKEITEEALDEGATQAASNLGVKETADSSQSLTEGVGQAAALGGVLGAAFGSGPAISNIIVGAANDRVKAENAKVEKANFDKLNEIAQQTEMAAHSNEEYSELIKEQAADTGPTDVYIDGKTFMQSGLGEKAGELSQAIKDQLQLAAETGGTIQIPMEEYMSKLATSEIASQLANHIKTDPTGFSAVEAEEYLKNEGDNLEADVKSVIQAQENAATFNDSRDVVAKDIKSQLESLGRFTPKVIDAYSGLVASWYSTRAANLGVTPEDLYNSRKLGVVETNVIGESLSQKSLADWDAILHEMDNTNVNKQSTVKNDETEFLSNAPEGTRYNNESPVLKRIRRSSDKITNELGGSPEAGRVVSQSLGPFSGYTTSANIEGDHLNINVYGKEQTQKGGAYTGHPALTFTVSKDGELTVDGPPQNSETYRLFSNEGWAEPAKGKGGEVQDFWTSLKNPENSGAPLPLTQMAPLLADIHARVREWRGEDKVGLHWSRSTGATGSFLGGRQTAVFFQSKLNKIDTPEFKKWFGDSKVVDENGKPLVVYHGTTSSFDTFKESKSGNIAGYYAAPYSEGANTFAQEENGSVMPMFASIKNPASYADYKKAKAEVGDAPSKITKNLQEKGFDGYIDENEVVAFDASQFKSAIGNNGKFDLNNGNILNQDNRGFFNQDKNVIGILQNADLSTFLHEIGHFFFDNDIKLASELIKKESLSDGEQSIVNDVSALLKWNGIEGQPKDQLSRWNSMTIDEQREAHERTAESFEHYLFTGNAPTTELSSLFQSFSRWLTSVYKSLKDFLLRNPEAGKLNDEVRGIFDRMLATHEQIEAAERARSMIPMFSTVADGEKVGMSAKEFADIHIMDVAATNEAVDTLQQQSLRDMQWLHNAHSREIKRLQKEHKELRAEQREIAKQQVMNQPVYQAWLFLTAKENGGKLDSSAVKEMDIHEYRRKRLTDFKMTSKEDGIDPNVIADQFGFTSSDELIQKLTDADKPIDAIEKLTDERMLQEHGEIATPEELAREADKAIHNQLRAKVLSKEHAALAKATGGKRILLSAAKEFAARLIGETKIKDIRPSQYANAESKAGREATNHFRKGDIKSAALEKRNQVIQNQSAIAAFEAREEVDKSVKHLKKIQKSGPQSNMRGEALEQLNALLERFDLRTTIPKEEKERAPLAQWVEGEADRLDAVTPDLPEFIKNEAYRKHYRDMTLNEFRGLVDSVKQLELLARRENKQYKAIRDQNFGQERSALLDELRVNFPKAFNEDGTVKDLEKEYVKNLSDKIGDAGDYFAGEFLSPENIIKILSAGNFGAAQESLFSRMSHASDDRAERLGDLYKEMKSFFDAYSIPERLAFSRKGIFIPEINKSLTKENIMMVALYNGNPEGRERLKNFGWSDSQIQKVVDHLDEKDVNLIEKIWDTFDHKLWPELKALNERTIGKSPPKVTATPFMINGKKVTGGYMRLKYDNELDERAQDYSNIAATKALLGNTLGMSAKTNQATSQERKEGVKMRLRLDLGVFAEAINETVHDIAFREAVADTIRVLKDKSVMNAIKQTVGIPAYRSLVTYVRDAASPPTNPNGFIEKALNVARKNTVVNLMSGVKTALQNFTGITPAMAKISPNLLSREIALYATSPKKRTEFAMSQSAYLRRRIESFDRDLNDMTKKLSVGGSIFPSQSFYLGLMSQVDRMVSIPVWNAAFKDGMEKFDNDQSKAVDYADYILRTTQGSGREVDLSQIQTGHGSIGSFKKVFTMFYSYFNAQLGLLVTEGAIAKREAKENPSLAVAKYTAKFIAIVVIPTILTELLMRGIPDEDDDEHRWSKAFASYGFSMIPFFRDIAAFALAKYSTDEKYHGNFKLSPIQSSIETAVQAPESIYNLWTGDASAYDEKQAIMGTAFLLGLPGKLISDTIMGAQAWINGDAGPEAVILGPPKK